MSTGVRGSSATRCPPHWTSAHPADVLDQAVKARRPRDPAYNPEIDASPSILVLCTGNICRSPIAEGILRTRLAGLQVPASVTSAGLTFNGRAAEPDAVAVAKRHGADISAHSSRIMDRPMLAAADLIIAMERMHAREVMVLEPSAAARTFTLKELVRRAEQVGRRADGEPFDRWLGRIAMGRRPTELLGASPVDDVADPFRRSHDVYLACGDEVSALVDRLLSLGWPSASGAVA